MAFYFSYAGDICNCWLKIVNHWDKRDNGVVCIGKETQGGGGLVDFYDGGDHVRIWGLKV